MLTAQEVCDIVKDGKELALKDVDVVTTATRAIMSGTYAVLSFPMAEAGSFVRAEQARINGVPASIGPCPNERLGIVDLMIYGTAHSKDRSDYGGGHLFRELVEGKEVQVEVETNEGDSLTKALCLDDIPYAQILSTRNAFKGEEQNTGIILIKNFVGRAQKDSGQNLICHLKLHGHSVKISSCWENPVLPSPELQLGCTTSYKFFGIA